MGKLVAAAIRHRFRGHVIFAGKLRVQLRPGVGVGDGYLNRLDVELLGEIQRSLDGFLGFARQADNEVPVDSNAHLLTIFRELARLLDGGAFLDVLQDLRVARFKSDDEESCSRFGHGFECLVITVHASRAGPAEAYRLELGANVENPLLANVERIVIEKEFFRLRKQLQRLAHFTRYVLA